MRRIYGPRHPDGTRIVKTVVLLLPRGNRKTSLSAALALLHTMSGGEAVPGGEVIFAASDQKKRKPTLPTKAAISSPARTACRQPACHASGMPPVLRRNSAAVPLESRLSKETVSTR